MNFTKLDWLLNNICHSLYNIQVNCFKIIAKDQYIKAFLKLYKDTFDNYNFKAI